MIKVSLEYLNNLLDNKGQNYTPKKQMITSYFSGITVSIMTMPIWTIRLRISLLTLDKSESTKVQNRWNYFYLVIKESIQKEGLLKLYKGFFSSIILSLHGGVQMTIYETGRRLIIKNKNEMKNSYGSALGVVSKLFASFLLYPFNVIRARQQQFTQKVSPNLNEKLKSHMIIADKEYGLFLSTIKVLYISNGIKGFYKGLAPSVLRQIPGSSVFFYVYEYTLKQFNINK
jgi:solute carrier family 25 folate transporter 32